MAEFQVDLDRRGALTEVRVRIEPEPGCPDAAALARSLEGAFRRAWSLRIPVDLAAPGELRAPPRERGAAMSRPSGELFLARFEPTVIGHLAGLANEADINEVVIELIDGAQPGERHHIRGADGRVR